MARPRNSFSLFVNRKSGNWYFWYYDGETRRMKSTGLSGKIPESRVRPIVEKLLADIASTLRVEHGSGPTLRAFAKDFYEWDRCRWVKNRLSNGYRLSRSVASQRRGHLVNYVFPVLGDKQIGRITTADIEWFISGLKRSTQTKKHIYYSLNFVFEEARKQGIIEENPCLNADIPVVKNTHRASFTAKELSSLFPPDWEKLLEVWQSPKYATLALVLYTSGMRLGEVRALMWGAIRFPLSGIAVLQAIKHSGEKGRPKSGKTRVVPLPSFTIECLKRWRAISPAAGERQYVFFGRDTARPITTRTVDTFFSERLRVLGYAEDRALSPASLRRAYNTRMRQILRARGVPEEVLREAIGQSSESMTDLYDDATHEERLAYLATVMDADELLK